MQTSLRKMGNSTGMIIPKAMLDELGLVSGARVDVRVVDGEVILRPVARSMREGWEDAAKVIGSEVPVPDEREWTGFDEVIAGEWEW